MSNRFVLCIGLLSLNPFVIKMKMSFVLLTKMFIIDNMTF